MRFSSFGGPEGLEIVDIRRRRLRRGPAGRSVGRLEVPVARTFPLEEVADAHRESESGHADGKIVLLP